MANIIDLTGKLYIITGAGSGIGCETACVAAAQGATVIMLDVNAEGLAGTAAMGGERCHPMTIDLTDSNAVASIVKQVVEQYGKLDGLVHCAGISSRKPLNMLSKEGFSKVMDVNFYSFVDLVKNCAKKKHFNDGASIVVMSSISSIHGYKAKTEYCVSKAAVDAFVRCMALELADRRIRVNSVMAAEVLTPLALKARELNTILGAAEFEAPLGPSEPFEVANTIAFLLSDATKTITGTSILIDGGACA
ncbi:MAG: SDR family oxidoreductase [Bacteroidales bacterium]|nr:SDR family oxidoreductase [Bacteroidales bacterium]